MAAKIGIKEGIGYKGNRLISCKFFCLLIAFGVLWFVIAVLIGLFIRGDFFNNKFYFRLGIGLIMLSFLCGMVLLGLMIYLS